MATDLLNHITPNASTVAAAVVITGPLKISMLTGTSTNTVLGAECADANYSRQAVTFATAVPTAGAGYGVGVVTKASNVALTFGGVGGFAVGPTFQGWAAYSSDATPVAVAYANFASPVVVPSNQTYTVASGSCTIAMS